ncbi:F-box domain-containing protein [Mycena sanguinolenta]|uniref:F-box domain-containing protein n=1 Tax=Mycena sanguinolenta TaxID=230812 RepID=A0A8H6YPD9_9AGAR|nr:F-box domain-containing protein [Mycena sanguinolenta]
MVLTRRAHRERMEISRWLPNEVLVQIIQHSPKVDQATLCRVSKLIRDLSLPVLYRIVRIKDTDSVTFFCSAIIGNPFRADAVRFFTLDPLYDNDVRYDLILATLELMLRLEHLSIAPFTLDDSHSFMLLENCTFPQLISCDLWVPGDSLDTPLTLDVSPSDLAVGFLARHSTLQRIHFRSDHTMVPSQSAYITLPNLEFYEGDAAFIPIIDGNGLKEVALTWRRIDNDHFNVDTGIIIRLNSMTTPDSPFVSSHRSRYWDDLSQILTSVSQHMRHTQTLRLQFSTTFMRLSQERIIYITGCLRQLTCLVYFDMAYPAEFSSWPLGRKDEKQLMAQDQNVAEGWGAACPSLRACSFNLRAFRKVDVHYLPAIDFLAVQFLRSFAEKESSHGSSPPCVWAFQLFDTTMRMDLGIWIGIAKNPFRAEAVRSFTLDMPHDSPVMIRGDLILAALKLMLRLAHLSIPGSMYNNAHCVSLLQEGNFPQLISCHLWVPSHILDISPCPLLDLLAGFLARHLTLKRIQIHSEYRIVTSQPVRTALPHLEFYQGDAGFILAIDATSLKEIELTWCPGDDVDKIIIRLSSMIKPN